MPTKKRVMICGASGFIGRNLFEYFNSLDDYEVYGTYLKNRPQIPDPKMVQSDLRDKETALRVTKNMDVVINAAALTDGIGIFSDNETVQAYAEANKLISANLAEAVCMNKVRNYIFLSCTVMYPSSDIPLSEEDVDRQKIHTKYSVLANMKLFGEERCRYFADPGTTKYTVARHTNIYGPYDKFDLARGHVLSATITKVMSAEEQITVWGKGEESRDFLYISDLIKFIIKAIKQQTSNFEIFNVGLGRIYSINELVETIIKYSGKKLTVTHDLTKPSIETRMTVSVEKVRLLLGWQARINLSDGISKTIEWYKNNPR